MGLSVVTQFDQIRRVAAGAGTFDGTFRPVFQMTNTGAVAATAVLSHKARIIKAYNNTNDDAWISFDMGVTVHDVVPANGGTVLDLTAARADTGGDFFLGQQLFIYIRTASGAAATGGGAPNGAFVYFTIIYGLGE